MTEKLRKNLIGMRKESMAKFNSARENFEKRGKRIKADLEEASKIWAELSGRFRWWGTLP